MNDLPRRDPAPLYPRPGRFEETLRRARKRRQRSTVLAAAALVVVCAGGVAGAMSLASNRQGGPQIADPPAVATSAMGSSVGSDSNTTTAGNSTRLTGESAGPTSSPSPSGTTGSHSRRSNRPSTSTSGSVSPSWSGTHSSKTNPHQAVYHGRAVDASGQPLAQIGVYVETNGKQVRVATTGTDGSFEIPVTTSPVLLASGGFGNGPQPAGASGRQNYAYTYVDASAASSHSTVMNAGGELSVTVTNASGQPIAGSTQPSLYCGATDKPCYTMSADSAGRYTYSGLPTGDYTLRGAYTEHTYHVTAGQTTSVTWVEGQQSPPASPTTSPSPTPSTSQAPSSQGPSSQGPSTQGPDTDAQTGAKTGQTEGTSP